MSTGWPRIRIGAVMWIAGPTQYLIAQLAAQAAWRTRSRNRDTTTQRGAWRKLAMLDAAETPGDLRVPPGNRQWRICFRWSEAGPEDVEIVDYH